MIFILLVVIAFVSYTIGSFSVRRLSSRLFFHNNLSKLGKGNKLLTNFKRTYGNKGIAEIALTEIILDLLPILLGGLLLKSRELSQVGQVFALFCVVMGKQWPFIHYFKGEYGAFAMIVCGFFLGVPAGIVTMALAFGVVFLTKYRSLMDVSAAFALLILSYFYLDNVMISKLCWCLFAITLLHFIPRLPGLASGQEERFSLTDDISWKFERNF